MRTVGGSRPRRLKPWLGASVLACSLAGLTAPAGASAASLLPDLQPISAGPAQLCKEKPVAVQNRDACTGTGRTVLRVTSKNGDFGKGPLELAAVPPAQDLPADCHGDGFPDIDGNGTPDDHDVLVEQRIFNDANGDGVFQRSTDTGSTTVPVGCRYYHAVHNHYHLEQFVQFALVDAETGELARANEKISFCINDTGFFDVTLPGAPQPSPAGAGYYDSAACKPRDSVTGVSIGWNDTYGWKTPGQEIDISGLATGDYCVITTVDPADLLSETNEDNNVRRVRYHIDTSQAPTGTS